MQTQDELLRERMRERSNARAEREVREVVLAVAERVRAAHEQGEEARLASERRAAEVRDSAACAAERATAREQARADSERPARDVAMAAAERERILRDQAAAAADERAPPPAGDDDAVVDEIVEEVIAWWERQGWGGWTDAERERMARAREEAMARERAWRRQPQLAQAWQDEQEKQQERERLLAAKRERLSNARQQLRAAEVELRALQERAAKTPPRSRWGRSRSGEGLVVPVAERTRVRLETARRAAIDMLPQAKARVALLEEELSFLQRM